MSYTNKDFNASGLTKREYFAAAALQGLCASIDGTYYSNNIAESAVRIADKVLLELELSKPAPHETT